MQEVKESGLIGNTNALKYKDEASLIKGIEEYFKDCDKREKPYTMTGLAYWLGITRQTLINYSKRDLFFTPIKRAKEKVQQQIEENILDGTFNTTAGIFNLKANYKWDDGNKVEVTVNHPKTEKVEDIVDNSNLEGVLYEENRHNENDTK